MSKSGIFTSDYKEYKLGDIIETYHKGYWRLTQIERRYWTASEVAHYSSLKDKNAGDEYAPLFYYELVMTANFKKPKKTRVDSCDAGHCKKIDRAELARMRADIKELEKLLP